MNPKEPSRKTKELATLLEVDPSEAEEVMNDILIQAISHVLQRVEDEYEIKIDNDTWGELTCVAAHDVVVELVQRQVDEDPEGQGDEDARPHLTLVHGSN